MSPTQDAKAEEDIKEPKSSGKKSPLARDLDGSISRRTLLSDDSSRLGFANAFNNLPGRMKFLKFGSASARFKRLASERDEISRSVVPSTSHGIRDRFAAAFSRKIDWSSLIKMCKEWIREPMNMALFVWIFCVGVSGAILFLVMTGMLNNVLTKKSQRDAWFEVNNQILNALFTLMCLYQHPKRFYHLVLLCRWRPEDISRLRKIYCKNGTYKPHEWAHMMVVVVLLHINCFAQYALCGLNLGYRRSERPAIGVGVCISVAIAAPAFAGLYTIMSPLGKDYDFEVDEEAQIQATPDRSTQPDKFRRKSLQRRYSFAAPDGGRRVETAPNWSGGIFDFWQDISLAYLSLFCGFCVFGWNMERLGFGNMYVHIATFILFCMAPFWIFNLAAVNIDNEAAREALSVTGVILCVFGLLYGGFWRIQMRKRYNLPPYNFCFGKPSVSDCVLWLCCCWCSLAQEVRTGNSYDIVEQKFYLKNGNGGEKDGDQVPPSPLPREETVNQYRSGPSSPSENGYSVSPMRVSTGYQSPDERLTPVKEENCGECKDHSMNAPAPLSIHKEAP